MESLGIRVLLYLRLVFLLVRSYIKYSYSEIQLNAIKLEIS